MLGGKESTCPTPIMCCYSTTQGCRGYRRALTGSLWIKDRCCVPAARPGWVSGWAWTDCSAGAAPGCPGCTHSSQVQTSAHCTPTDSHSLGLQNVPWVRNLPALVCFSFHRCNEQLCSEQKVEHSSFPHCHLAPRAELGVNKDYGIPPP